MPKLCPNITFPHQQDFFPIRSVTKSSTARFSHENLVEKFKIFVQDFVPIRTALTRKFSGKISSPGNFGSDSPSRGNFEPKISWRQEEILRGNFIGIT